MAMQDDHADVTRTQQLARLALDADIEPPQTDARHSDYCDAAVVSRQVVTHTWTRSFHHLKSVCTQATEADGIRVVPRFAEEQHVDGEVATNVKQIVELVGRERMFTWANTSSGPLVVTDDGGRRSCVVGGRLPPTMSVLPLLTGRSHGDGCLGRPER